jgi:deoxyribose-phosphate aldolase
MRANSAAKVQVKAAGGVRTLDDLLRVSALGVTRIGATATAAIIDEAVKRGFPGAAGFATGGGAGAQAAGY